MSYRKGSAEGERETRHARLMGEVLQVANRYSVHSPGEQRIEIMNFNEVEISTYYHSLEDGVSKLNRITSLITVHTTSTVESSGS